LERDSSGEILCGSAALRDIFSRQDAKTLRVLGEILRERFFAALRLFVIFFSNQDAKTLRVLRDSVKIMTMT
jgi:hypothetical protein